MHAAQTFDGKGLACGHAFCGIRRTDHIVTADTYFCPVSPLTKRERERERGSEGWGVVGRNCHGRGLLLPYGQLIWEKIDREGVEGENRAS
jgi:hypothetical protein